MSHETPKALRLRLKVSQTAAAAEARMAPNTYRVAELCREAVSEENQAKLDAFVARLRERLAREVA